MTEEPAGKSSFHNVGVFFNTSGRKPVKILLNRIIRYDRSLAAKNIDVDIFQVFCLCTFYKYVSTVRHSLNIFLFQLETDNDLFQTIFIICWQNYRLFFHFVS